MDFDNMKIRMLRMILNAKSEQDGYP